MTRTLSRSTSKEPRFDPDGVRLNLIVTGESLFVSQPLPAAGELVIGRASDADVRVDHPSVSREHAVLRLGTPITIEDLGSANGTRLRGRPLVPHVPIEIQPGEVVDLGSVLLDRGAGELELADLQRIFGRPAPRPGAVRVDSATAARLAGEFEVREDQGSHYVIGRRSP